MACDLRHEEELHASGQFPIAGIDEAGRGPLAGPVTAAAVILPKRFSLSGLDDSKKLTAKKREFLYQALTANSEIIWHVSIVSPQEIDQLNILRATHLAMRQAAIGLTVTPTHLLVDGLPVPQLPYPHTALVKGDSLSLSIAAASIIAKVTRDRIMQEMDTQYPEYGFRSHQGYGTASHLRALEKFGPCPIHRRSFAPVAQSSFVFPS